MNKLMAKLILLSTVMLAGCASDFDELKDWVKQTEKNAPRKIEALPEVKQFEPFAYEGFDLPDPFKPRKLRVDSNSKGIKPDFDRRKEPLESFPLEVLKMVGSLTQNGVVYGLVRADKTVYRVKAGNHMGQNFGKIIEITEAQIKLKEIVQDTAGDWSERQSDLPLLEEGVKK